MQQRDHCCCSLVSLSTDGVKLPDAAPLCIRPSLRLHQPRACKRVSSLFFRSIVAMNQRELLPNRHSTLSMTEKLARPASCLLLTPPIRRTNAAATSRSNSSSRCAEHRTSTTLRSQLDTRILPAAPPALALAPRLPRCRHRRGELHDRLRCCASVHLAFPAVGGSCVLDQDLCRRPALPVAL